MANISPALTTALALTLALTPLAAAPLSGDHIRWGAAGENYQELAAGLGVESAGGTMVKVWNEGPAFFRLDQSRGWYGAFRPFEELLWNYYGGAVTLDFGGLGLRSLTLQLQPDLYGDYTALLEAFDGEGTLLAAVTQRGHSNALGDGSAAALAVAAGGPLFHRVRVSLLEAPDVSSFAIGTVAFDGQPAPLAPPPTPSFAGQMVLEAQAVPEPSSVVLALLGIAYCLVCAARPAVE